MTTINDLAAQAATWTCPPDEDWHDHAACRDMGPDLFFPTGVQGVNEAKEFCRTCPVQPECLEHALTNRIDHGIWGGRSERERRRILKRRKLRGAA